MKPGELAITSFCVLRNKHAANSSGFRFQSGDNDDFGTALYLATGISYPKFYKMDRLSQLGFLAAELLLNDRIIKEEYAPASVGVVLANAHASLDTDQRYFESVKTMASPALFVYTLPNIVAGEICIRHGIKGENAFFVSEQFDSAGMAAYVEMVMSQPGVNACLAGWVEVMGDHHDVFLYLTERSGESKWIHSAEQLQALYHGNLWNS